MSSTCINTGWPAAKPRVNYIINFKFHVTLGALNQISQARAEKAYRAAIELTSEFRPGLVQSEHIDGATTQTSGCTGYLAIHARQADDHTLKIHVICNVMWKTINRFKRRTETIQSAEEHLFRSLTVDPMQPKVIQH